MNKLRLYIHHLGRADGLQTEQLERMLHGVNCAAHDDGAELGYAPFPGHADLCIMPGAPPDSWFEPQPIPRYVVFDSADGCELSPPIRELLCSDHPPAAVWKHYRFSDPTLYNRFGGRWDKRGDSEPLPPQIPVDRLERIKAPFGYGAYSGPRGCQRKPIGRDVLLEGEARAANRDRPIDVSFCGNVFFSGDAIEQHRKACCAAIRALPPGIETRVIETGIGYNRRLGWKEYVDLLYSTKIIISPFGGGEMCFRDYEALYAGCFLIKPGLRSQLRGSWSGDPISGACFCYEDFAYLRQCVEFYLTRLSEEANDTRLSWGALCNVRNSPATVGRRLWQEIKEAIGTSLQG